MAARIEYLLLSRQLYSTRIDFNPLSLVVRPFVLSGVGV